VRAATSSVFFLFLCDAGKAGVRIEIERLAQRFECDGFLASPKPLATNAI